MSKPIALYQGYTIETRLIKFVWLVQLSLSLLSYFDSIYLVKLQGLVYVKLVKLVMFNQDSYVITFGLIRLDKVYELDQVSYNSYVRLVKIG